jgi:hypothetical protein
MVTNGDDCIICMIELEDNQILMSRLYIWPKDEKNYEE